MITGSHAAFPDSVSSGAFGDVTEEILTGRKYLVVRAIGDTTVSTSQFFLPSLNLVQNLVQNFALTFILHRQSEKGNDAQKRIIKEFYDTVEDVEPN